MEVEVEALNADPSPLEKLDVDTIVDHYEGIIRGLESPRIKEMHVHDPPQDHVIVMRSGSMR